MGDTVEVGGEAPTQGDWSKWLQDNVSKGLQSKWDVEYLQKLVPAQQAPSVGVSAGTQQPAAPFVVKPWMFLAGALVVGGLVFVALKA